MKLTTTTLMTFSRSRVQKSRL